MALIQIALIFLCLQHSTIFAKNVVDFDDNDIERLYRQWEVGITIASEKEIDSKYGTTLRMRRMIGIGMRMNLNVNCRRRRRLVS